MLSPAPSARANPALLSAGVGRGCPLSLAVGMLMDTEDTVPGTVQEEEKAPTLSSVLLSQATVLEQHPCKEGHSPAIPSATDTPGCPRALQSG